MVDIAINTLLVLIGLVIVLFQVRSYLQGRREEEIRRQSKEEERTRLTETIQKLLDGSGLVSSCVESFMNYFTEVEERSKQAGREENIQYLITDGPLECLEAYKILLRYVDESYTKLLKNEDHLSFSYGFGRYIDAFREFRASLAHYKKACAVYQEGISYIQLVRSGKIEEASSRELSRYANNNLQALKKLASYINRLAPFVDEMQIKYSDEAQQEAE